MFTHNLVKNFTETSDQNDNNSNDKTKYSANVNEQDDILDFLYIQEDGNLSASRLVKDFLDEPPRKQPIKSAFTNKFFEDIVHKVLHTFKILISQNPQMVETLDFRQ